MTTPPVRAFHVWVIGHDGPPAIVIAETRDQARYDLFLDLSDVWEDLRYIDVRARLRLADSPMTSPYLAHVARYRGVPFVRAGMEVELSDGRRGRIVGHSLSANFEVLIDGIRFVCHPDSLIYFDAGGEKIKVDIRKLAGDRIRNDIDRRVMREYYKGRR